MVLSKNLKLWTIVQFKHNTHKAAARNLNQQNFETFLPFEKIVNFRNKKYISTKRPLFPGYMFVAFEEENINFNKIKSTYGVSKLLSHNDRPYIIPEALINSIIAKCDEEGVFHPPNQFSVGDNVRIANGPFNDFIARVESIDKNQRVWILIDIMGQSTRASIKSKRLKYAD